jgi:hypothetical protein
MGVGAIRIRHRSPEHHQARCFDEAETIRREPKQPPHPQNTGTSRGKLIAMYKDRAACLLTERVRHFARRRCQRRTVVEISKHGWRSTRRAQTRTQQRR